ncbi:uncharacterized protein LOC118736430 [Rhagoletis pomonella]|uniref:uncharacterized protein LOC118736430 n=1 Tax=Rhagoletis pomonella TaxID=28610 RepID=UPI0017834A92|nr:uncharacterized protein LOC118736430 [Rhagoletis pomonella]
MDLSLQSAAEAFSYRHKKFDKRKRSRDEEAEQEIEQVITPRSTLAGPVALHPAPFYGAERVSTPLSTDSNCSSDYAGFVARFNASSTPSSKRRRLLSGGPSSSNPSEDSGIAVTPQKQTITAQQLPRQLKRTFKPSALADPPAKAQKTVAQHVETNSPAKSTNAALKRTRITTNINIPHAPITTTIKTATKLDVNSIKAAVKPTAVGTLELSPPSADANSLAAKRALSLPSATVLSRISEDKLRSICSYHGNMVRQFPKKERSPKDQERRNKNTIACRISRRLKKLEQIAVEEQCKEFEKFNFDMLEEQLRGNALLQQLHQLEQLTDALTDANGGGGSEEEPEIDVVGVEDNCRAQSREHWNRSSGAGVVQSKLMPVVPRTLTVPSLANAFSIAYLMGHLQNTH